MVAALNRHMGLGAYRHLYAGVLAVTNVLGS